MKKESIKNLIPDNKNFNVGNELGEALIEQSFEKFGAGRSILVDKNNRVIAGNKSLQKFAEGGGEDVVIIETDGRQIVAVKRTDIDLDTKRGREMALADNATAKANITWDGEALLEWGMPTEDWGVFLPTTDTIPIETDGDAEPEMDRAAELNQKWKVAEGTLYRIGNHRLLCGDSTKAADVHRLLDGAKPHLTVTDPPYGVEYDASWRAKAGINKNTQKMGKVLNDDRADWTAAWELSPSDVIYVYHAGLQSHIVHASLEMAGFELRSQIIWAKDRMALGRGDYHWKHEPCWYAVRKGATSGRNDDRTQTTVWEIPARDDSGHGHSTQKPLECMTRPIRNHEGDVYEPFAGSGTTIVAAQNLHRKCYAMELNPEYCAVILERMQTAFPEIEIEKLV